MNEPIKKLPLCCQEFDIDLYDLVFPDHLPKEGREFVKIQEIYKKPLGELIRGAIDMGNGKVKIFHRCPKLGDDGLCTIYATRPQICRAYVCQKPECPFRDICLKNSN